MASNNNSEFNPFKSIPSILMFLAVVIGLFWFGGFLIDILYYVVAPILFIATLIINHKVVLSFGKWFLNLFKTNILYGVGVGVFTFFMYPFVAGFLLIKALFLKKVGQIQSQAQGGAEPEQGDFAEYEELEVEEPEILELPTIENAPKTRNPEKPEIENQYDDLFGES